MSEDAVHYHPQPVRAIVYGRRLKPGEAIEATDVYNSTTGKWEKAPCPGLRVPDRDDVIWIRPAA